MTRQQALALLHEHIKTPNLLKHLLATEALMRGLARKFAENEEKWGLAGLLHDIDYDETRNEPAQHSIKGYELLTGLGVDPEICQAIKIHNYAHGLTPVTLLDKALYCGEAMTGFIVACALVQPDKKLSTLTLDSVMKKFRSKSFAAGANREVMLQCESLLGIKIEELAETCLKEMLLIDRELGL